MKPVILCCPVRNELHNLTRLLPAWNMYVDQIVVADQMSTDGTREYLSGFDNVHIIENRNPEFNEPARKRMLVDKARSLASGAILLFLDADETLSANVTTSLEWNRFLREPPGTTGYFSWVQLWGSIKKYIAHGEVGLPGHSSFAFIDDGRALDPEGIMHGPRGPGMKRPERRFYFNDVVNLHFFLTNMEVYRKKQNWYKQFWIGKGGKFFYTNRNHIIYEKVRVQHTEPSPPEWYAAFEAAGLDLSSASSPELLWYDVEILQTMHKKGARSLWLLDIWNQDWEHLRQLAIKAGHSDIPQQPIQMPPGWIMRYTNFVLGRTTIRALLWSARRYVMRKILP